MLWVVYGIPACGVVFYGNSLAWLMAGTYIHYKISNCKINKSKEFNCAVQWFFSTNLPALLTWALCAGGPCDHGGQMVCHPC